MFEFRTIKKRAKLQTLILKNKVLIEYYLKYKPELQCVYAKEQDLLDKERLKHHKI